MAYRRKTTTTRRKATPARRRRRTMGQRVTTAGVTAAAMSAGKAALGGAAAAILTNVVGDNLGKFQPYVGLVGALATSLFLKQPEIAAGMAGYSGYKIAGALLPDLAVAGGLLAENNNYMVSPSMYLQGDMAGEGIYASNYTLAGYEVPGM
jgi:hypothetical protein